MYRTGSAFHPLIRLLRLDGAFSCGVTNNTKVDGFNNQETEDEKRCSKQKPGTRVRDSLTFIDDGNKSAYSEFIKSCWVSALFAPFILARLRPAMAP